MYEIRLATIEDVPFLQEIERMAGKLFSQFEFTAHLPDYPTPLQEFYEAQSDNLLWVAALPNRKPIGFALVYMLDGGAHLEEVDVHPDYGQQGVGTRLVQSVIEWAQANKILAVTLTTFRQIPWNAPFYQKLGFRILGPSELTPELEQIVKEEEAHDLARELRAVMRIETATL